MKMSRSEAALVGAAASARVRRARVNERYAARLRADGWTCTPPPDQKPPLISCGECGQPLADDNCPDICPCETSVASSAPVPKADHPHSDPGDGRIECDRCGKFVWLVTHSCKGVPVTDAARRRYQARTDSGSSPVGQ